jgi:hypothetical protein
MLRKLLSRLRSRQDLTPEDLTAQAEAKEMRYDIETLRTGDLQGPPLFTHGGKESRGR